MRIIHNETLRPILVQVSHELGLTGAPMSSQRQTESRVELVT